MINRVIALLAPVLLPICVAFLFVQCRGSQPTQNESLESVAEKSINGPFEIIKNQAGTMALAVEKPASAHISKEYKFAVIAVADNKVIRSGTFQQGYVKWIDNDSIEVFSKKPTASDAPAATDRKVINLNQQ